MSESLEQKPFDGANFADNPESRCPLVLLLDASGSMGGEPIRQLNEGVKALEENLKSDPLAAKRVEIAIVSFGPVKVESEFVSAAHFYAPELTATGDTPMGAAIETGIDLLNERKNVYKQNGISYYRPWIFLITDGSPTDPWANAAAKIREGEASKKFSAYSVAVENGNLDILRQIFTREPLKLKGLNFRELFVWLSSSMSSVSRSQPGDTVSLTDPTAPNGWATTG